MEENVRSSTSGRLIMIKPKRQQLLPVSFNKTRSRKKFQDSYCGIDNIELAEVTKFVFLSSLQLKPVPHLFDPNNLLISDIHNELKVSDDDLQTNKTVHQLNNIAIKDDLEKKQEQIKDCNSLQDLLVEQETTKEINKGNNKNDDVEFVDISTLILKHNTTSSSATQTDEFIDISSLLDNKEKSPLDLTSLLVLDELGDSSDKMMDEPKSRLIEEENTNESTTTLNTPTTFDTTNNKTCEEEEEGARKDEQETVENNKANEEDKGDEISLRDLIRESNPLYDFTNRKIEVVTPPIENIVDENQAYIRPKIETLKSCPYDEIEETLRQMHAVANIEDRKAKIEKVDVNNDDDEEEEEEQTYSKVFNPLAKIQEMRLKRLKTEDRVVLKREKSPVNDLVKFEEQYIKPKIEEICTASAQIKSEFLCRISSCLKQEPVSGGEEQENENEIVVVAHQKLEPEENNRSLIYDFVDEDEEAERERSRLEQLDIQLENEVIALIKNPNLQIPPEMSSVEKKCSINKIKKKREPQCKICSQTFPNYVKLKKHRVLHVGDKPYPCMKCGEGFSTLEILIGHLRVHEGKWAFVCKKCGKGFRTLKGLGKHQAIHILKKVVETKKAYKCEVCDKEFRKVCDLDRHMRVHTGEKPSVCKICNQRFQQQHNLNKHLLIHTQEKPHKCDICNKRFGRNDVLNRHLLTHSVTKPFHCTVCPKTFIRSSQLNAHLERYHKAVL